jgi:carbamoyltransferase
MADYVLGIWDGHDSGAALVQGDRVLAAINEERLTRRKLEIRFPDLAIKSCLQIAGITPSDINTVAVSTADFAKTLARLIPSTKEEYYLIRRRKKAPGLLSTLKKRAKYSITEIGPSGLTRWLSTSCINSELSRLGFTNNRTLLVDHHLCHAASAAYWSGFDTCLVLTVDGIGDGLSGTVSRLDSGRLTRLAQIPGRDSLGIFFEHVTNLMNMRELEDEGKVMAIANYAYPIPDSDNPMLDFISIDGMQVRSLYGSLRMYTELRKLLWKYPSEQFAYMAQRTLEVKVSQLAANCLRINGLRRLALAGGVFSNIKLNMQIRLLPEVDACCVFPHMGDGGLALGAAFQANNELHGVAAYTAPDVYWGLSYNDEVMLAAIRQSGYSYTAHDDIARITAQLIAEGNIVFWLQGAMEYGPRSLGRRSILALPNSTRIKDLLNLRLKMRVWYQPFCPSMLAEEASVLLENHDGLINRFMTMGYMVKQERRSDMQGVMSIDGSCRPQFVTDNEPLFRQLLLELKKLTGSGVVLNTSFNVHGDPLVCSPQDALETLKKTSNDYLVMGRYLVKRS